MEMDFMMMSGLQNEELFYLKELTKDMSRDDQKQFALIYQSRRKDPQTILLLTLIGFLGVAGIQRFVVNQIGMGIVYVLTAGFCGIGTIVDLINHKFIALS